jgi:GDP-L-fucose synthase
MIECNVIQCAWEYGVKRLLFLGSSCIYPKESPQPIKESYLLSGYLEPTNEAYAVAKIAGLKMCHYYNLQHGADFICAMPTNLYGPNDNFNPETAHVVPALIHKMARAKASGMPIVKLWGTGTPRRELMYIDDLADACLFLMDHYHENKIINIGTGEDIAIKALAELIQTIVGYQGKIQFDSTKPDGTYRKLLDVSVLKGLGWSAKIRPEDGIRMTYDWYLNHPKDLRI